MRSQYWAFGLLSPAVVLAQSIPQAAVSTISIGVCLSDGSTGGYGIGGSGNGTGGSGGGGPGSGSTVVVTSVSSPYGMYSQLGWYADTASGNLLGGSQTTSPQMSLTYCALFCGGTTFFAVENGDVCLCGSSGPTGTMVGATGSCTPCSGSAGECCGSDRIGIVYTLNPSTSSSTSVDIYTTTDSSGNTITTSSTSNSPYYSISGSDTIISYSTTNSQGSVITKTTTLPVPSPSTSVTVITTINSQGSTVTATSTSVISSATAVPTGIACGDQYTDPDGSVYQIYCADFPTSDLIAIQADSEENCLFACSEYISDPAVENGASCVAVSYNPGNPGGNCYLKYDVTEINPYDGNIISGILVSYQPRNALTTVSASSAPGASHASAASTLISEMPSSTALSVTTTSSSGDSSSSSDATTSPTGSSTPLPGQVTTDGSCGAQNGNTICGDWPTGGCCSTYGYCGDTAAYCDTGCQSGPCSGTPTGSSTSGVDSSTSDSSGSSSDTSASPSSSSTALPVTTNGTCGGQYDDTICGDFPTGACCSLHGYCGNSTEYCGIGCQSGPCDGAPILSGDSTSATSTIIGTSSLSSTDGSLSATAFSSSTDGSLSATAYSSSIDGSSSATPSSSSTDGNPSSSSGSSSSSALPPISTGVVTRDGTCGAGNGDTVCGNWPNGACCSQYGYCGNDTAHCGTGCQSGCSAGGGSSSSSTPSTGGTSSSASSVSSTGGSSSTSASPPISSGGATIDGTCGAGNGNTVCGNWPNGACCSQYGYCGNDTAHCGTGCQNGPCSAGGGSSSFTSSMGGNLSSSSIASTTFPTASPPVSSGVVTKDGTCGMGNGNTVCGNWPNGACCSQYGFCGNDTAHCGAGCQNGPCLGTSSSSSSTTNGGSSSSLASSTTSASTAQSTTTNGSCGAGNGNTVCGNWPNGACCSQYGFCGNDTAHCGAGCQNGPCTGSSSLSLSLSSTSTSASPTASAGSVTTDGSCGAGNGNTVCGNWPNGACCSQYGFCGNDTAHCGAGCQNGPCTASSSLSSTSASSTGTGGSVTTDGSCGTQNGNMVCGNFYLGGCCSSNGYCGNTTAYCGDGCQSGPCYPVSTEPTITHEPACPADNNTRYTDIFSTTYDVRCGLQIVGNNGYPAHADTFAKCLEYCDILGGCAGVTYHDGAASTDANCFPYTTFSGYNNNAGTSLYSGVATHGPTTGSASNMVLCPQDNGANYTDTFGNQYLIGCDSNIAGSGNNGIDLRGAVAPSLDGCLLYCSIYSTCAAVDFTGYPPSTNAANCFPKYTISSSATAATGTQYAIAN